MFEEYNSNLSVIRYHWGFGDPFYAFNPTEAYNRLTYYPPQGSPYIPHGFIDGEDGQNLYNSWRNIFLARQPVSSPLVIDISGDYNSEDRSVHIDISVEATEEVGSDTRLFCVLVESDLVHSSHIYHQVMRDMIPNESGEIFEINNGETLDFERDFAVHDDIDVENSEIVVFVQNYSTKEVHQSARVSVLGMSDVDDEEQGNIPSAVNLLQNYPNPFNANTNISFDLPQSGDINLSVYNLLGQKIETLIDSKMQAGQHSLNWDASKYSSGVYFYKLTTEDKTFTKRMTLMK